MAARRFRDQCLKVLDRVAATKVPVTITKRGRPVATLIPHTVRPSPKGLSGSILAERGDPFLTGEPWDADPS